MSFSRNPSWWSASASAACSFRGSRPDYPEKLLTFLGRHSPGGEAHSCASRNNSQLLLYLFRILLFSGHKGPSFRILLQSRHLLPLEDHVPLGDEGRVVQPVLFGQGSIPSWYSHTIRNFNSSLYLPYKKHP